MASVASRRLFSEFRTLSTDSPEGIVAGPISEDDIFKWEALIQGPEGTPFEGGVLVAELTFPKARLSTSRLHARKLTMSVQDYPLAPPTMKFVSPEVFHPNGTSPEFLN